jgi:uncharacterized membrane protein YphA (DoxX/SURF4 family)
VPRTLADALAVLRRLRDAVGDTYLLALARIGLGLLLLNEAWLAITQLREAGFFGDHFHQPFLPESLVPSEATYHVVLGAQLVAAVLVASGRVARPALLVAAGLLVYVMLCDRLWFHHYRHTLAAFSTLLAFAPCDRQLVLGRVVQQASGPLWAQSALRAQVSLMYLASGGSKLLDPEWRGGQMMAGMVRALAHTMLDSGVPASLVAAAHPSVRACSPRRPSGRSSLWRFSCNGPGRGGSACGSAWGFTWSSRRSPRCGSSPSRCSSCTCSSPRPMSAHGPSVTTPAGTGWCPRSSRWTGCAASGW